MDKIQNIIIAVLVVALLATIAAFAITVVVKNNTILELKAENSKLSGQIGAANMSIKIQNQKIEELAINNELKEKDYQKSLKNIRDDYAKKLDSMTYSTCEDMLNIISTNQKEFLHE